MSRRVEDLVRYRVPDDDLKQGEYCFLINVDFTRSLKDAPEVGKLKQIVTGLLNTSGGIVIVRGAVTNQLAVNKWSVGLWEQLEMFVSSTVLQSCIKVLQTASGFQIIVKQSQELITLNSHLHTRGSASSKTQTDAKCILGVVTNNTVEGSSQLDGVVSFLHRSEANIQENDNTELKCWSIGKVADYKKKFDNRTRKALFSLANAPTGGDFAIGISEDKEMKTNCVIGQSLRDQDLECMERIIGDQLCEEHNGIKPIWGTTSGSPSYRITFIPVENAKNRWVIRIRMDHCQGGAFEKCPESYIISEDGFVESLSFHYWKQLLVTLCGVSHSDVNTGVPTLAASPSQRPTGPIPFPSSATGIVDPKETLDDPEQISENDIPNRSHLSWTTDRKQWYSNIIESSIDPEANVLSFLDEYKVFNPSRPLGFTPSKETILARFEEEDGLCSALSYVEDNMRSRGNGFALASLKWSSNFQHNTKLVLSTKHLLDILTVSEDCQMDLWTFIQCDANAKEEKVASVYALVAARLTKRKLLFGQRLSKFDDHTRDLYIHCHMHKLASGDVTRVALEKEFVSFHNVQPKNLRSITKQLALLILDKDTYIRDILGTEFQIRLTAHQMEKILSTGLSRFNFICGPPGCGKTYMALHLSTRFEASSVHYVCTTNPFHSFLKYQGLNHPILATNESEFLKYIDNTEEFLGVECLILDDAQLLGYSQETWTKLFELVHGRRNMYIYLFADCTYQNFGSATNANEAMRCMMMFCMSQGSLGLFQMKPVEPVIHRNHRKVVSFIKSCFESNSKDKEHLKIACSQQKDGDDVEVRHVDRIFEESGDNGLVQFVGTVIGQTTGFTGQINAKNTAILVDTCDPAADAATLRSIFRSNMCKICVHDATVFPVKGLTVDTLDNFVGLDRKTCILLTSDRSLVEQDSGRSIKNPKYKAFVASRAISRVAFVVGKTLDRHLAAEMKMNKMSVSAPRLSGFRDVGGIRDLCFLEVAGQPVVFHLTFANTLGLMSMSGDEQPLPIAHTSVNILRCTASTSDRTMMVLVDCDDVDVGPWRWTVYIKRSETFEQQATYEVDGWPWSLCWAADLSIIMIVKKGKDYRLKNYLQNGCVRWDHGTAVTKLKSPRRVQVDIHGMIYVADFIGNCVYVFTPQGEPSVVLPTSPDPDILTTPHGMGIDLAGRWLFVSHYSNSDDLWYVSMLSTDGKHIKRIPSITTTERMWSIDLYKEQYLTVGTEKQLCVFDISDVL